MKHKRLVAVLAVAPMLGMAAPVVPPAQAQEEGCNVWTAGMMEDEGGSVLTAQACSEDSPDSYLSLKCFSDVVLVSYDLSMGSNRDPELHGVTDVTFVSGTDEVTLSMAYQEMDGMHAADVKLDDPLIQLLKAGDTLIIKDVPGDYPSKQFSLKGSSAAIGKLVADCD